MVGTEIALGIVAMAVVGTSVGIVRFVVVHLRGVPSRPLADDAIRARGSRALATVVAVRRIDRAGDRLNVECTIEFLLCPGDGTEHFPCERHLVIPRDAVPNLGDSWPAWYLPSDPEQVLVVAPAARHLVATRGVRGDGHRGRDDHHSAA